MPRSNIPRPEEPLYAFPHDPGCFTERGITMRDYFAAAAIPALVSHGKYSHIYKDLDGRVTDLSTSGQGAHKNEIFISAETQLACAAYKIADEMMEEGAKRNV